MKFISLSSIVLILFFNCSDSSIEVRKMKKDLEEFCNSNEKEITLNLTSFDYVFNISDHFTLDFGGKIDREVESKVKEFLRYRFIKSDKDHGEDNLVFTKGKDIVGAIDIWGFDCILDEISPHQTTLYTSKDIIVFKKIPYDSPNKNLR